MTADPCDGPATRITPSLGCNRPSAVTAWMAGSAAGGLATSALTTPTGLMLRCIQPRANQPVIAVMAMIKTVDRRRRREPREAAWGIAAEISFSVASWNSTAGTVRPLDSAPIKGARPARRLRLKHPTKRDGLQSARNLHFAPRRSRLPSVACVRGYRRMTANAPQRWGTDVDIHRES